MGVLPGDTPFQLPVAPVVMVVLVYLAVDSSLAIMRAVKFLVAVVAMAVVTVLILVI
jgi:hypothetical protein